MNKKIITALAAIMLVLPISANAALKNSTTSLPSVAIIDTAIDSSMPQFNGRVIYEACFTSNSSCPNNKPIVEGQGAAYLSPSLISNNGFDHGTGITSVVLSNNPNLNVVFIRIIGIKADGTRAVVPYSSVSYAINWAVQNKDRFNIKAISMSQGNHNLKSTPSYCPSDVGIEQAINSAVSNGVPVFFATGNNWDTNKIDFPSCIPNSIAVAALDPNGYVPGYSNFDINLVDFVTTGFANVLTPKGTTSYQVGTSISAPIAAANWVQVATAKPTYTYNQIYDLLVKTAGSAYNSKIKTNRVINLQGALNG